MRRAAGVVLALVALAAAPWLVETLVPLWPAFAFALALILLATAGPIADTLTRTSRSRSVNRSHPARGSSSGPRSGGPVRDSHAGGTRPAPHSRYGTPGGRYW